MDEPLVPVAKADLSGLFHTTEQTSYNENMAFTEPV